MEHPTKCDTVDGSGMDAEPNDPAKLPDSWNRAASVLERLIGTIRREYLDRTLFWTTADLENKLLDFQTYFNEHRTLTVAPGGHRQANHSSKENHSLLARLNAARLAGSWSHRMHSATVARLSWPSPLPPKSLKISIRQRPADV
jgi:hypothetical protein